MHKYLLDTHTFIWFIEGSRNLSKAARQSIEADNVVNLVSIASLWEIAIKISLNKLELKKPFKEIKRQLSENDFEILPVTFEDTFTVSTLPFHHRDPFDRILVAQAITNGLEIISKDELFSPYGLKVIW